MTDRSMAKAARRTALLAEHLLPSRWDESSDLRAIPCLSYTPPEKNEGSPAFSPTAMRKLLDYDNVVVLEEMFSIFANNQIFWPKDAMNCGRLFTSMDYNSTKEEQRDVTFQRILFLRDRGYFKGWLSDDSLENLKQKSAMHEAIGMFDHSMAVKLGVHIHLWGGAVKYLGTRRHHEKWLKKSEDYEVAGCFALTELGHGSNVRGIETIATYDAAANEFIINTPCETAQKYWIGGAAMHANHTVAFAQLHIGGRNEGVHAFIVPIRDSRGRNCPGVRIADCGHKNGLNGIDNGRIWFDSVRIPRENLLNAVGDVTEDGRYVSAIKDVDQRFAAFMAPLTGGRVTIAISAINQGKIGLAIALRYALSRRAFTNPSSPNEETLLLDYSTHQRRLLPLLAKNYAMNFATNDLKRLFLSKGKRDVKAIHVRSSGLKATTSWHMLRALQECREACGGMGFRSDNRLGQLRQEHDVMATFEGDNVVLMQTVSKALLADYLAAKRKGLSLSGLGLEHMNAPRPIISSASTPAVLRDPSFHLALFQLRERDLLEKFAEQVSRHLASGRSMYDAFNESFQLGTDLGRAHSELEILTSAQAMAAAQPAGAIRDIIHLLNTLYVLVTVDEDPVFLRYGYITPVQSQSIQTEVTSLCADLRPHTLALVDSMGLPPHLLGPIAFDWVDYESWHHLEAAEAAQKSSNGSGIMA